jgi:hypothetical protein
VAVAALSCLHIPRSFTLQTSRNILYCCKRRARPVRCMLQLQLGSRCHCRLAKGSTHHFLGTRGRCQLPTLLKMRCAPSRSTCLPSSSVNRHLDFSKDSSAGLRRKHHSSSPTSILLLQGAQQEAVGRALRTRGLHTMRRHPLHCPLCMRHPGNALDLSTPQGNLLEACSLRFPATQLCTAFRLQLLVCTTTVTVLGCRLRIGLVVALKATELLAVVVASELVAGTAPHLGVAVVAEGASRVSRLQGLAAGTCRNLGTVVRTCGVDQAVALHWSSRIRLRSATGHQM